MLGLNPSSAEDHVTPSAKGHHTYCSVQCQQVCSGRAPKEFSLELWLLLSHPLGTPALRWPTGNPSPEVAHWEPQPQGGPLGTPAPRWPTGNPSPEVAHNYSCDHKNVTTNNYSTSWSVTHCLSSVALYVSYTVCQSIFSVPPSPSESALMRMIVHWFVNSSFSLSEASVAFTSNLSKNTSSFSKMSSPIRSMVKSSSSCNDPGCTVRTITSELKSSPAEMHTHCTECRAVGFWAVCTTCSY